MSSPKYSDVFTTAFRDDTLSPYAYQCRLAGGPEADPSGNFVRGTPCHSQLIEIPTGLGKTAGVVLAWLWNRVLQQDETARKAWPRRLVYCLPMRTLVEQTRDNVKQWLESLAKEFPSGENDELGWLAANSPVILMGGEDNGSARREWDIYPEKPSILIGTQDMLLSRALNRGYGMSRYRWPMHFGLLNNDALWIMDETQLMGVSVETSAQLDGFRSRAEWLPAGACPTWWMSATLDKTRLATVDHPQPAGGWPSITLSETERSIGDVQRRYEAKKPITKAAITLSNKAKDYAAQLAALVAEKHKKNTLTLVVVNRVQRAQQVYSALKKLKLDSAELALIHSRFRPVDRKHHTKLLFGEGDRIVVATQAVEAGVDVSARLLITELAPWSSVVQRFGRCNRYGEQDDTEVLWIDVQPKDDKDDLTLPYSIEELGKARTALDEISDASPQSLAKIQVPERVVIRPVLRRRDLVDLFDTTPDLCGQDLDISRYIRDDKDSDVQFFWRNLGETSEKTEGPPLSDDELCRVSIRDAGKFVDSDKVRAFIWDPLEKQWNETKRVRPGCVYLIEAASGGYSERHGWTKENKNKLDQCPAGFPPREAYDKDRLSFARYWQELGRHTEEVVEATDGLAASLALDSTTAAALHTAAQWHDLGKAHDAFQKVLRDGPETPPSTLALYAKSKNPPKRHPNSSGRPGFRHELASALAWLLHGPADAPDRDLIAYIIAAHHGKVRLSIRALPDEKGPDESGERPFARGVWHGDELRAAVLPGVPAHRLPLDLSFMHMGDGPHGPSWLARMIALRDDDIGLFRLAYLETLLRAADMRASAAAEHAAKQQP